MSKVLVIGGCGHLGSYVSAGLAEKGFDVTRLHRSEHDTNSEMNCVVGDFRRTTTTSALLEQVDVVVHLASQSVPRTSADLGVKGILDEVEANARLFQAAAESGVGKIVFASSGGSVYGECTRGHKVSEDHPLRPVSPHGLLKAMTEMALAHVARTTGLSAISLRPGNIYGPGQRMKHRFGVVPTFLANLKAGRTSEIWGPDAVRDYVFVQDAANAFIAAVEHSCSSPETLNVGTGQGHTALEVYSLLQQLTGLRQPVEVLPRPATDPSWSVLSTERLASSLGVTADVALSQGLRLLIADASTRGVLETLEG